MGNSPDNVVENIGSILMDRVEEKLEKKGRYELDKIGFIGLIRKELRKMKKKDTQLLRKLVLSFGERLKIIAKNGGVPLKY